MNHLCGNCGCQNYPRLNCEHCRLEGCGACLLYTGYFIEENVSHKEYTCRHCSPATWKILVKQDPLPVVLPQPLRETHSI